MGRKNGNSFQEKLERIRVGEKLKAVRKEKRISAEIVKESLKISNATLSNYENGIGNIPVTNFVRLCKILNLNISDFEDIINEKV